MGMGIPVDSPNTSISPLPGVVPEPRAASSQGLTGGRKMRSLGSELSFPYFTPMGQKSRRCRLDHHLGCKF